MRSLVALVAALLALESAMWSALAPLLAGYGRDFDMSHAAVGLLAAAYTAGDVVSASAVLAFMPSWKPHRAMLIGLVVLSLSTVGFTLASSPVTLTLARFVQGLGAGQVFMGGIAWLTSAAPVTHRGRFIGIALGASILGTVIGPAIGTIAVATDPAATFKVVALTMSAFVPWLLFLRAPTASEDGFRLGAARKLCSCFRSLRFSLSWVGLPSLVLGLTVAVVPLGLLELGSSQVSIGTTFLLASGLGCLVSVASGYLADRHGRMPVIALGLAGLGPCLLALGFSGSRILVTLAAVALVGCFYSLALPAAVALATDHANLAGLAPVAPALTLITITSGETVGSTGGGALAGVSVGAPFALLALASVAGAVVLRARAR
jgi:MFS family permease